VYKGICADFPVAPMNKQRAAIDIQKSFTSFAEVIIVLMMKIYG